MKSAAEEKKRHRLSQLGSHSKRPRLTKGMNAAAHDRAHRGAGRATSHSCSRLLMHRAGSCRNDCRLLLLLLLDRTLLHCSSSLRLHQLSSSQLLLQHRWGLCWRFGLLLPSRGSRWRSHGLCCLHEHAHDIGRRRNLGGNSGRGRPT